MEMTFGIIGALTGIIGIIISMYAFKHNKIEALNTFFSSQRDPACVHARRAIKKMPADYDPTKIQQAEEETIGRRF